MALTVLFLYWRFVVSHFTFVTSQIQMISRDWTWRFLSFENKPMQLPPRPLTKVNCGPILPYHSQKINLPLGDQLKLIGILKAWASLEHAQARNLADSDQPRMHVQRVVTWPLLLFFIVCFLKSQTLPGRIQIAALKRAFINTLNLYPLMCIWQLFFICSIKSPQCAD